MDVRHFVEAGWTGGHSYCVPADIYGPIVRDNIVIACADVVILHDGKILLVRRRIQPAKGQWWVIGGKMNPGESLAETAVRHLKRDMQIVVPASQLIYLDVYSTVFARREEPEANHGTHTMNFTFAAVLTASEVAGIQLTEREYEGKNAWQWFTPDEILAGVASVRLHPVLSAIVGRLQELHLL